MKKMIFAPILSTIMISTLVFGADTPTYNPLIGYMVETEGYQKEINLYSSIINDIRDEIEQNCDINSTNVCTISKPITITVTNQMVADGFMLPLAGSSYTIPANTFTFQHLTTKPYDYKVTVNTSKLYNIPTDINMTQVYQWDKESTLKSVQNNNEYFTKEFILKKNVYIESYNVSTQDGNLSLKKTMVQYDKANNGVAIKIQNTGSYGTSEVLLVKADNTGGFIHTQRTTIAGDYESMETFDSSSKIDGRRIKSSSNTWTDDIPIDTSKYGKYLDVNQTNFEGL